MLGKCINITSLLNQKQAETIAQWIGCSNVMRNQKIDDLKNLLDSNQPVNYAYAHIKAKKELKFLKDVPPSVLRNAASAVVKTFDKCVKGDCKFPKKKGRGKRRSCIITDELFLKRPIGKNRSLIQFLEHSKKKAPVLFSVEVDISCEQLANQCVFSRQGKKFFLSFGFNDGIETFDNDQLLLDFSYLSEDELKAKTIGVDRGVVLPAALSNGQSFCLSLSEKEKIKKLQQKIKKQQRYIAKQKSRDAKNKKNIAKKLKLKNEELKRKGLEIPKVEVETEIVEGLRPKGRSSRLQKSYDKLSKYHNKIANIKDYFLHRTSKAIVEATPKLCVFEDLKIKNMVKRPKKVKEGRGYAKNGAAQKSGLNRAMHEVALGQLEVYTKYKLNRAGKALVKVSPHNTSVIHNACKGTNTKRLNQETLYCYDCKVEVHADFNASYNIKDRGINDVRNRTFQTMEDKRALRKKKKEQLRSNISASGVEPFKQEQPLDAERLTVEDPSLPLNKSLEDNAIQLRLLKVIDKASG